MQKPEIIGNIPELSITRETNANKGMVRVNTYVLHYLKAAPAEIFVFETLPDLEVSIDVELILDGEIV